jgi:RNA polymerase sigma-70 factor (ECF subfamily)
MAKPRSDIQNGKLSRLDEQQIIRALQKGDHTSAEVLIDHHKQRLFAFVWRIVPNQQDAEDICQDAFIKAFSAIDSFDPTYRFSTWLFTIAYRLSLNHLRRKHEVRADIDFTTFSSPQAAGDQDVARSEQATKLRDLVWTAVATLTDAQRAAITLFYRESLSCQEIAEVLATPVATVKSHLFRARTRLKEMLEPCFAGDVSTMHLFGECA